MFNLAQIKTFIFLIPAVILGLLGLWFATRQIRESRQTAPPTPTPKITPYRPATPTPAGFRFY